MDGGACGASDMVVQVKADHGVTAINERLRPNNHGITPNATQVPPLFPQQFVSAPPPTAAVLYAAIPPEVQFNLYRVVTEGVRHEENTYGYFNSAFAHIFPPSQRFQVSA